MNTTQKKIIQQYISRIKSFFPAFYPKKKKILFELKQNLNYFCMEHNNFTMDELYLDFGSPQEYVSTIIRNTSEEELLKNIHIKKRNILIIGVIFVLIFAIGIASTTVIIRAISNYTSSHYYEIKQEETL